MELSISLLNMNYGKIKSEVNKYKKICDMLHIDVMDGNFVENISFGAEIQKNIAKYNKNKTLIDTHLMVKDPINHIEKFVNAGSDIITFHIEATNNPKEVIEKIKSYNIKAGIAINPDTQIEEIEDYLDSIDLVLVMSVWPGKGGQTYLGTTNEKLEKLKQLKKEHNYKYKISVDGGINQNILYEIREYIDIVVCGSYITSAENQKNQARMLMKCA